MQQGDQVIPIEIKSGKDYKMHTALNNLLAVTDWNLKEGIVFCSGNVEKIDKITYLPWYMMMFLKQKTLDNVKIFPHLSSIAV